MQTTFASKLTIVPARPPRFTGIERLILASGAGVLALWVGALAWAGYKIITLMI